MQIRRIEMIGTGNMMDQPIFEEGQRFDAQSHLVLTVAGIEVPGVCYETLVLDFVQGQSGEFVFDEQRFLVGKMCLEIGD